MYDLPTHHDSVNLHCRVVLLKHFCSIRTASFDCIYSAFYLPITLTRLACLAYKWLQIGTAMLLIIISTTDELLTNVNIDDLE